MSRIICPPLHQTGDDYIIPGGWTEAEVDQEIVDFAVAQFSGIDQICFHIQAENFQSKVSRIIWLTLTLCSLQMVAGTKYKFDIVLKHTGALPVCKPGLRAGDRCHVEVFQELQGSVVHSHWSRNVEL